MKPIDLTKKISKYTSGWLALSPDYKKVVGHAQTIDKAINQAKQQGIKDPVMMRAAKSYGPIAP
ncbi:MAG: hypothetical protein WD988_01555 [Candidatus Curtissbacteria bacterium]